MKKIFAIVTSLSLMFLLGCSFEKEQVKENQNTEKTIYEETSNMNEYEEINKISEKIDVKDYTINVESDNEGTRIILFEKNQKKMYKSIFVKEKRHLKLIDLQSGEKPLINETI